MLLSLSLFVGKSLSSEHHIEARSLIRLAWKMLTVNHGFHLGEYSVIEAHLWLDPLQALPHSLKRNHVRKPFHTSYWKSSLYLLCLLYPFKTFRSCTFSLYTKLYCCRQEVSPMPCQSHVILQCISKLIALIPAKNHKNQCYCLCR